MSDVSHDMPPELAADLGAALRAFAIYSPFEFSFSGEPAIDVRTIPAFPGRAGPMSAGSAERSDVQRLSEAIQATLYDRCYARRSRAAVWPAPVAADLDLVRRLTAANAGEERWDGGWVIYQLAPNGQVFVRKGERERAALPGAFISESAIGMAPQIGTSVRLRVPRETLDAQPTYYFAFGETLDELADQLSLVRLYFHCDAAGAVTLLGGLSRLLNEFQVPFQLKMPTSPALYDRADAAVLYVGARYFTVTSRIVAQIRETVSHSPGVPMFTKRLWPGIGAAVDPGTGESFGTHRCRLTAQGIVDAWQAGAQDVPARRAATAARFSALGLDLARPYLGRGVDFLGVPPTPRLP